ncbi:MAG: efflux RND transporter permease subunit [Bryobacterales bacterium]|nr:efflux RND transporter permease subunit [Bryobacterales bacterium]
MPTHNHGKLDQMNNTARYFVENRQVSWAVLLGIAVWGIWGYAKMPQRKDPEFPVHETLAIVQWPGQPAGRVEQLVTKQVEEAIAQNSHITEIRSFTKPGAAYVFAKFDEKLDAIGRELDDLQQKLAGVRLPQGVMPVQLVKDFSDTATLMLTVASPRVDDVDLDLRARDIKAVFRPGRTLFIWPHARTLHSDEANRITARLAEWLQQEGLLSGPRPVRGPGFAAFDAVTSKDPETLMASVKRLLRERLQTAELHPDIWEPFIADDDSAIRPSLARVAGPRYTYRELDRFTETIEKRVKAMEIVSRVNRSGLLAEQVQLRYSQDRWASYGIPIFAVQQALSTRSVVPTPGSVDVQGRSLPVVPLSDFDSLAEIGGVLIRSSTGSTVYLRDLVDIERGYDTPPPFLNYMGYRDARGQWQRARAVTIDIQMRSGEQIAHFNKIVSSEIEKVRKQLPADLIIDRTSDQPKQVEDAVELFMGSLWEAIALVVIVSWVGFWEWRSSLLMAITIPITLSMTFGMAHLLGVDLQQVSIASLIISLGLLVDDPVVAGDAIKRDLAAGRPRLMAAWQGPTKLARAILFATITNIVAYLPFLLVTGDNGRFLYALPVVMTCSLVASRIVSMTFVPMFGYYLLREKKTELTLAERRSRGFGAFYYRTGQWAIAHRWAVLGTFMLGLVVVGWLSAGLKQQFFPYERQYLSFVEVWLPQNSSISATAGVTRRAEEIIRKVAEENGRDLRSITSWVGGGGPRYWISSSPEPRQPNYAHILVQVKHNVDTDYLLPKWQQTLTANIPGATLDVRRLETSAPIGIPIQIRLSGDDLKTLRQQAAKLEQTLRDTPGSARVRNDWGEDILTAALKIDEDRASLAGISPAEVAAAATGGLDGLTVASLRDQDREIPVVFRMRMEDRALASDIASLYVWSQQGRSRVPLAQVATLDYVMQPGRIGRHQQFRTITVQCFPAQGLLASEVLMQAMPKIEQLKADLPAGMRMEIAGEYKEQVKGFRELALVMIVSVLATYFALVIQFRHAVKPFIVFAAIPFGIIGGLLGLEVMGAPFGFMAFLGVASLVGVIVSHIIVLFDFIEHRQETGEPLVEALLDAGILRLRPVLITVGATVVALVPLAMKGGPLWEPLCYVQIGGLTVSTLITLILVPVVYAIFVKDLKWVKWEDRNQPAEQCEEKEPDPVHA